MKKFLCMYVVKKVAHIVVEKSKTRSQHLIITCHPEARDVQKWNRYVDCVRHEIYGSPSYLIDKEPVYNFLWHIL